MAEQRPPLKRISELSTEDYKLVRRFENDIIFSKDPKIFNRLANSQNSKSIQRMEKNDSISLLIEYLNGEGNSYLESASELSLASEEKLMEAWKLLIHFITQATFGKKTTVVTLKKRVQSHLGSFKQKKEQMVGAEAA